MSSAEIWTSRVGLVVDGKFPLRQWLGGSDHSAVFLTERPAQPSQRAAIKLIPGDAADADRHLARWRAAAQLSHPHLLRIFDSGHCELGGTRLLYVVMEYAEEDLAQIFPQRVLTPSEVSELLPPLLDALFYLRGKGFVHSRIKPSNVLAVSDQLKLSSDQILSAADTNTSRRRDVYDAPETAAGIFSPPGDVWSVGVTLVAMLTQNEDFAGDNPQSDPDLPGAIPEPFRGIARECLHLDPRRRCSLTEIKARLQPPGRSVPAPVPVLPPRSSATHYRYTWRILIPIAILLLFGFAWRLFHKPPPPATRVDIRIGAVQAPGAANPAPIGPKPAASPPPAAKTPAKATLQGAVVHQVLPDVSQNARNTITGHVRVSVRVEVDRLGKVTAAKLASAGPSKYFANAALKAAQRWEFSPPQMNGQPAASAWLLHFRFGRASTEVSPERATR
jgi:TonB family protein